jgi:hypothetical protein
LGITVVPTFTEAINTPAQRSEAHWSLTGPIVSLHCFFGFAHAFARTASIPPLEDSDVEQVKQEFDQHAQSPFSSAWRWFANAGLLAVCPSWWRCSSCSGSIPVMQILECLLLFREETP